MAELGIFWFTVLNEKLEEDDDQLWVTYCDRKYKKDESSHAKKRCTKKVSKAYWSLDVQDEEDRTKLKDLLSKRNTIKERKPIPEKTKEVEEEIVKEGTGTISLQVEPSSKVS